MRKLALVCCAVVVFAQAFAADAAQFKYRFFMDGASENPVNASLGTGTGVAIYDDVAHTLSLSASWSGLTGTVTQTHFHAPTTVSGLPDNNPIGETRQQAAAVVPNVGIAVGNPSLPGFPTGVGTQSGVYANVINMTLAGTYSNAFLNAAFPNGGGGSTAVAESVFASALASGRTYWNIHSTFRTGGEIRGFPILVPEPASLALIAISAMGWFVRLRR